MIPLDTLLTWTARVIVALWIVGWPLAYIGARATNADLAYRLDTRTESYQTCMSGVERVDALVGSIEEHHHSFVAAITGGFGFGEVR